MEYFDMEYGGDTLMVSRESNRRLFAVKSVARGRGVVIMVENDNEPRKVVTKEAITPWTKPKN